MLYLRVAVSIFFLAVLAAGCGKGQEPVPVEMASGNMEELQDETAAGCGKAYLWLWHGLDSSAGFLAKGKQKRKDNTEHDFT